MVKTKEFAVSKRLLLAKRAYLKPIGDCEILDGLKISDNLAFFDALE